MDRNMGHVNNAIWIVSMYIVLVAILKKLPERTVLPNFIIV